MLTIRQCGPLQAKYRATLPSSLAECQTRSSIMRSSVSRFCRGVPKVISKHSPPLVVLRQVTLKSSNLNVKELFHTYQIGCAFFGDVVHALNANGEAIHTMTKH